MCRMEKCRLGQGKHYETQFSQLTCYSQLTKDCLFFWRLQVDPRFKHWNPSSGLEFFSIFIFDSYGFCNGQRRETEEDVSANLTSVLSEEIVKSFAAFLLFILLCKWIYYFSLPASGEAPDLNDTQFTKLDELLTQTQLYSKENLFFAFFLLKVRPENPSSRRKEVVDAKERSSIGNLNNFLSNFNDQVPNRLPTNQNGWYYMSMAGTICLALAAAKKLNRSPTSLRCKPATNVLITMSPVCKVSRRDK
ncbi:hypothetical protein YC2023_082065 [Brassica napus]